MKIEGVKPLEEYDDPDTFYDEMLTMREILSYQVGPGGFEMLVQAFPKSQRIKNKRKS